MLERLPALGARGRAAVHGHCTLERRALCGHGPRVVARVRLLLVRGVVLLVDADHAQPRHRREHGRSRTHDDRRLAARDPLALVATFRLAETRVENGDPITEPLAEATEGLRRERDLRDEHDRAEAALERGRAGPEIDLRLATTSCAREENVAPTTLEATDDIRKRPLLGLRERHCRLVRCDRVSARRHLALASSLRSLRCHECQSACGRRAVVLGDPEREVDERCRDLVQHLRDRNRRDPGRGDLLLADHDATDARTPERDRHHRSLGHAVLDLVRERTGECPCRHEREDRDVRHRTTIDAARDAARCAFSTGTATRRLRRARSPWRSRPGGQAECPT